MDILKRRRAVIKGNITRIHSYCTSDRATLDGILVRKDNLEEYFKEFATIQDEIESSEQNISFEDGDNYRDQVENTYYTTLEIIHNTTLTPDQNTNVATNQTQLLNELVQNQTMLGTLMEVLTTNRSTPIIQTNNTPTNVVENLIQLPRINLPEFDGTYTNWIRFRDLFDALIHKRSNLTDIEKFEYLQGHVKGDALSLIKNLKISNENYTIAWNLIKSRYDDSAQIKNNYLKILFDQPSMRGPYANELKSLLNNINECVNALKALNEQVDQWDSVLIYNLEKKLDIETQRLWYRASIETRTISEFTKFLGTRLRELEICPPHKFNTYQQTNSQNNKIKFNKNIHATTVKLCPVCKQQHLIYYCQKFKDMSIENRIKFVRENSLCVNCLQHGHQLRDCKSSTCKKCRYRHNTLLHKDSSNQQPTLNNNHSSNYEISNSPENKQININSVYIKDKITLIPTAIVMVEAFNKEYFPCRILLDTGAQATLITERCVQRLQLKRTFDKTLLNGIGKDSHSYTRGKVTINIKSRFSKKLLTATALCLQNLTQDQPSIRVTTNDINFFKGLNLADPNCTQPSQIDVILGADVLSECLLHERISHPSKSLSALNTIFGWVIMGNVSTNQQQQITIAHASIDLSSQLQQFWTIEELQTNKNYLSDEEQQAENHYQQTVNRNEQGRYIVRLPFKNLQCNLDNNHYLASKRLSNMELKFIKNKDLHDHYTQFMNEYINLDHMKQITDSSLAKYYLPHHAVWKLDSTTTKMRVVFDGTAKRNNNMSLNESLLIGPTIQNDLFTILLRFRKYEIGMTGDIEKMYRQILIHPEDQYYQCILWREGIDQPISVYQLQTITYGTSAAPFLAVRTLKQIALDNMETNSAISNLIINSFYVDDFMASFPDIQTAIQTKTELCNILSNAGMNLRKWSSNSEQLLQTIDNDDRERFPETIIDESQTVKTLGLRWDTQTDTFTYKVVLPPAKNHTTKREVLSIISRIFDPLGWVSPYIINLKTFMQILWLNELQWDSPLPAKLESIWQIYFQGMIKISKIKVPRWLKYSNEANIQIHGFADASEVAYVACIYLRVVHDNGTISTRLINSKTRVSPVKKVTTARLELCACHLLVKLLAKTKVSLNMENVDTYGWTDSKIVIAWLSNHPRKWKNFVANRTSEIIEILPANRWRYIGSTSNPADLATRGLSPEELQSAILWWNGPEILQGKENEWQLPEIEETYEEAKRNSIFHVTTIQNFDIFSQFSTFNKLLRITALIFRFKNNCQTKNKQTGYLTSSELQNAQMILIKQAQHSLYNQEIKTLRSNNQLSNSNKLSMLSPFLDKDGILRVGGRLKHANISYNQKHPIILHKDHLLTQLIISYFHYKYLHAGTRQLYYLIGLTYWIPSISHAIKQCVYKCITCTRYRNSANQQLMGDLPRQRFELTTAFHNTGVDFAGPFFVRSWKGRGSKQYKAWISLFVCLVTKAIHLELVTDLSSDAFIATLRRFVARRGRPANMYSDNGTNFVGSNQKLKDLLQFMQSEATQLEISKFTTDNGIEWHFTPPSAPHFGGLWEAGVKSMKYHMHRVIGNSSLTYEEFSTVLCQIESCLNSRPLTTKFEGDIDPLTPGHFLILKPMQSIPDKDFTDININRLNRWQYIQQLVQLFWKKWSMEYINQLQTRPKWKLKLENLKVNDVVLIKNEQTPPCKWPLGLVSETHPGTDGVVRVVTVKTQNGVMKRPITKLCPLIRDLTY